MSYFLFFTIFFFLYGGMHLYAFFKARAAFSPGFLASLIICLFMVVMTLAPFFVRYLERDGLEGFARVLTYVVYTWMGAILIFFVMGMLADLFRLLAYVLGSILKKDFSFIASAHSMYFFTCLCAALFVVVYSFFEARCIRTEHISIPSKKIAADVGRVRIAQISDVHLGLIIGEERLKAIIQEVQKAKPDILVSTGDLLDAQPDKVEFFIDRINEVFVPHGKFAVTGNHEVYLDHRYKKNWSEILTVKAGFILLDNQVRDIEGLMTITGISDEAGRGYRHGDSVREENLCSQIDASKFTVLLKHRPVPYTGPLCKYDLQLSGHTHKGQIFPFFLITRLFFTYYAGLYELSNNAHLYVSRGSGTWGPPIRFLAPPEVTIIDIVHKAN